MRRLIAPVAGSLLLAVALSSCGGEAAATLPKADGPPASSISIPKRIGGLAVVREPKVSKKFNEQIKALTEATSRPYITDGVGYSLREGKELKAVLQIARLTPDASPDNRDFRIEVINQIGSGSTRPVPFGKTRQLVYVRDANQQAIFAWFNGRFLFILIVRQDKLTEGGSSVDPAALLTDAVRIQPPQEAPK